MEEQGDNYVEHETFNRLDIAMLVERTISAMDKEVLAKQIEQFGNIDAYKQSLELGFCNKQNAADIIKWYGSKEKAMEAMLLPTGKKKEKNDEQDNIRKIYRVFFDIREKGDEKLINECVKKLAEAYVSMYKLDDAKTILLDIAKEYLQKGKLCQITDSQYGDGFSEYIAKSINRYYGI